MSSKKTYIGKGKQNKFETVRVNIALHKAEEFIHTNEHGEKYLTFYVSKLQQEDKFKNTHTAYCLTKEEDTTATQE